MAPTTQAPPERLSTHPAAIAAWDALVDELFAEVFREASRLSVSEWAERKRILSKETTAEPGPWRNDRTPYLVEIMDALSDPEVTELVVMKSARIGYTEGVIGNGVGYFIDQDPAPILVIQPTQGDAEDWSKKQLVPMLRDSPCLAARVPEAKSRDSGNTILDKAFTGGSIAIRGAHSPRGLRRLTARVVFFDEVSGFERSAGSEGDPVKLGETRADTFPNRKIVKGSTPTVLHLCRITQDFERTDQRRYYVPCPHCAHEQVLRWGGKDTPYGMKWDRTVRCSTCREPWPQAAEACGCGARSREVHHDPDSAYYLCEKCGVAIEEREKPGMVRRGRWIATRPENRVRGYHINALISLISAKARWASLVREFIEAEADPTLLQVFVNTVLAEPWEEKNKDVSASQLEARVADRGDRVPAGAAVLTAAVDVQGDRLEVAVWAWGDREEGWNVRHHRIYGNTEGPEPWRRLDAILQHRFLHESGAPMHIAATAVDAGYLTETVYGFVRERLSRGVLAMKGNDGRAKSDLRRAPKPNKYGVKPWTVATWSFKDVLFKRLKLERPGPGYLHFCQQPTSDGMDAEYFAQFGAERAEIRKVHGRPERIYRQIRDRNEAIDLYVNARAALHTLGAAVLSNLGALAAELAKPVAPAPDPEPAPPIVQAPAFRTPRPPGGFVSRW